MGIDDAEAFRELVRSSAFPCVGAKSALSKGQMRILVARDIRSNWDDVRIYDGIKEIVDNYRRDRELFQTFIVIFREPTRLSEETFERFLWERVESLTNKDAWHGQRHDARVSSDPEDPHFSLSFEEEAFFVVGLHPNASRQARRFKLPSLVFNLHDQFERLRDEGRYEKLREVILERDVTLSGSENPMLARHGVNSEARQYSGRSVDEDWKCPFNPVVRS
ncbi:guanitoxin biosynthesis heme-dependent pre-guanitoxin N-hydroxylase GntA [Bradyrhizobium sp. SYSU BS000235]|uniref:guanitoxin biosynthesis heme-dependent pre-guanitoxin N-hydroxylase GntA n=1 Tax=Bradyrhizobium sp. SYSU BS000235 TaxID=3411332 RepID=UPI003C732E77